MLFYVSGATSLAFLVESIAPSRDMISKPRIRRRQAVVDDANWPDSVPSLLRRVYAARGVNHFEHARPRLDRHLLSPDTMSGLNAAVALLTDAIAQHRHIVIVGDFDADGATACAVGVRGLRMLGATHVSYAVPNRMTHGYGLSPALVAELAALKPELLMTVDHGIACHAGIAEAKARGWNVLVTDHHLPGEYLPCADAIVDPNLPGDGFPSKALAGVGVVFYLLLALRSHLHAQGRLTDSAKHLASLLDLVAVGTVADLVPLDTNNRTLVSAGLRQLKRGEGCAGLRALMEVSRRSHQHLSAADIGFAIAPRLNAAGRLEDMSIGIECLLCDDIERARELARSLDDINSERRAVQSEMTTEAEAALARTGIIASGDLPMAVCLFDTEWHPGLIGLVASKLKDRLHRPTIAFAPTEPGSRILRGSARSIQGFHIRDGLAAVDASYPNLIVRFGGHAMAAGLTLEAENLPLFQRALNAVAGNMMDAAILQSELWSDGELASHEFDRFHAEALRDGGPWGQGFPEPTFDGEFSVLDWQVIQGRHLKLRLQHRSRSESIEAIHFHGWQGDEPDTTLRLVYRLAPNDYRGGDAIQLLIEHRE
jgi:single-stranded-DNA-specific exonuclease